VLESSQELATLPELHPAVADETPNTRAPTMNAPLATSERTFREPSLISSWFNIVSL